MGKKDKNLTDAASLAVEDFIRRVDSLGNVTSKKMFGGYGIFESGKMFALVNAAGFVFLKVGDANRAQFEMEGSHAHGKMPYYRIPDGVMADEDRLHLWTKESIQLSKDAGKS